MDLGRHPFGRVYSPPGFGLFCKIVHSNLVDGEAIGRGLQGSGLADNIKPDRMLGGVPPSKRGVHVSKRTSEARNRS